MHSLCETNDTSRFEALLQLLDDDTPLVREAVTRELQAFGTGIGAFIGDNGLALNEFQWDVLDKIMAESYRDQLRAQWPSWLDCSADTSRLEDAMSMLAVFQNGPRIRPRLSDSLDALAADFLDRYQTRDHRDLARFLFRDLGFHAVAEQDEGADAGNLSYTLEKRRGLPITLVILYMLVGGRHDLKIAGCNWPGSFYARFHEGNRTYMVDCCNGGVTLEADELLRLQGPSREAAEAVLSLDVDAVTIVRRVLSNLAFGYRREGSTENSLLVLDLLRALERAFRGRFHEGGLGRD